MILPILIAMAVFIEWPGLADRWILPKDAYLVFVVLVALIYALMSVRPLGAPKYLKLLIPAGLWVLALALSAINPVNIYSFYNQVGLEALGIGVYVAIVLLVKWQDLKWAYCGIGSIWAIFALGATFWPLHGFTSGNTSFAASWVILGAPFGYYAARRLWFLHYRLSWLVLIPLLPALYYLNSDAAWIALVVLILALLPIKGKEAIPIGLGIGLLIISIWGLPYGNLRQHWWSNTLEMVREHPVTGIGRGNFELIYPQYAVRHPDASMGKVEYIDHLQRVSKMHVNAVHNDFLQVWVETGTVGLLAFGYLLWSIFGLARLKTEESRTCWLSLLAFLVIAWFHFPLGLPVTMAWLWMMAGMMEVSQ